MVFFPGPSYDGLASSDRIVNYHVYINQCCEGYRTEETTVHSEMDRLAVSQPRMKPSRKKIDERNMDA